MYSRQHSLKFSIFRYQYQHRREGLLTHTPETLTLSPNKIKAHHPKCPKLNSLSASGVHKNNQDAIASCTIIPRLPKNTTSTVGTDKQMSSPDISEMVSVENIKNNALNNCTNFANMDDKQKIVLLKIPNSENVSTGHGLMSFYLNILLFRISPLQIPWVHRPQVEEDHLLCLMNMLYIIRLQLFQHQQQIKMCIV